MCQELSEVFRHPPGGPDVLHRYGLRGSRHHNPWQVRARGSELGTAEGAAFSIFLRDYCEDINREYRDELNLFEQI